MLIKILVTRHKYISELIQYISVLTLFVTPEGLNSNHFLDDLQKFSKLRSLKQGIQEIDKQLNKIRNEGRQLFLETNPNNFSRIIHDYSNERKGFVLWKDALEERLV